MNRIKKGRMVIVKSGNDKNKQGKVLRVFIKEQKALVENINIRKNYMKADPQKGITGGIISKEAPISFCKLMLCNTSTQKADKIKIKYLEGQNKRVACFRSDGQPIDKVEIEKV